MRRAIPFAVLALVASASRSHAQSACVTPNCLFGDAPQICRNTAVARIPAVLLTSVGGNFVFVPAEPRIEPGGCIQWRGSGVTHSSTGAPCPDDFSCGAAPPLDCNWDSGNLGNLQSTTCFYDEAVFPINSGSNYFCRIHATPTVGTMRGIVRVTTPIVLTVQKNPGTGAIDLSWTGGGVPGDISYKLVRSNTADPKFGVGNTTTVNPQGGVLGTTYADAGEFSNPASRYYLVRKKQTNEP